MLLNDSGKIDRMANARAKLTRETLRLLTKEMGEPRISASAVKAMRPKGRLERRELVIIDSFHGYECSRCGCRFPEYAIRKGPPMFEERILKRALAEKEFSSHTCHKVPRYV